VQPVRFEHDRGSKITGAVAKGELVLTMCSIMTRPDFVADEVWQIEGKAQLSLVGITTLKSEHMLPNEGWLGSEE
jgi:hypothetical protein